MAPTAIISAKVLCLSPKKWGIGSCKHYFTHGGCQLATLSPYNQRQKKNDVRKAPPLLDVSEGEACFARLDSQPAQGWLSQVPLIAVPTRPRTSGPLPVSRTAAS